MLLALHLWFNAQAVQHPLHLMMARPRPLPQSPFVVFVQCCSVLPLPFGDTCFLHEARRGKIQPDKQETNKVRFIHIHIETWKGKYWNSQKTFCRISYWCGRHVYTMLHFDQFSIPWSTIVYHPTATTTITGLVRPSPNIAVVVSFL